MMLIIHSRIRQLSTSLFRQMTTASSFVSRFMDLALFLLTIYVICVVSFGFTMNFCGIFEMILSAVLGAQHIMNVHL